MRSYRIYTKVIFVFIFLVVIAGSVVRTTQSGMGCPDWPKCFGSWIPPTSADDLPADFEKYLSKQDIDHTFNVYHTWIEYINRLFGALLGVLILIHFGWTLVKRKTFGTKYVVLSGLMVVLVGFSGWLGKLVVDHNLAVAKISLHMISALVLAFVPLIILNIQDSRSWLYTDKKLNYAAFGLMVLLVVQLFLGIQLRENIDEVSKTLGYLSRETWLDSSGVLFFVHRSFSWLILGICVYMLYNMKDKLEYKVHISAFLILVVLLFIIGIGFSYMGFPAFMQPMHLLFSLLLICLCFDLINKIYLNRGSVKKGNI